MLTIGVTVCIVLHYIAMLCQCHWFY